MKKYTKIAAAPMVLFLLFLGLALRPPLWYYTAFTLHPRVLPARLVRPAIRFATGHRTPERMQNAIAIICGGRDPVVLARFQTDSDGIEYILERFGRSPGRSEVLEERDLRSGWNIFPLFSQWQNKLAIHLYDQDTIHSARLLTYTSSSGLEPSYTILVDDRQRTIYLEAHP